MNIKIVTDVHFPGKSGEWLNQFLKDRASQVSTKLMDNHLPSDQSLARKRGRDRGLCMNKETA